MLGNLTHNKYFTFQRHVFKRSTEVDQQDLWFENFP